MWPELGRPLPKGRGGRAGGGRLVDEARIAGVAGGGADELCGAEAVEEGEAVGARQPQHAPVRQVGRHGRVPRGRRRARDPRQPLGALHGPVRFPLDEFHGRLRRQIAGGGDLTACRQLSVPELLKTLPRLNCCI